MSTFENVGPFLSLYLSFGAKVPLVCILNLWQKMSDKILKKSCQYVHFVQSKVQNVQKTTKMVNFLHNFHVYSVKCNWIILIHCSSYQTSPWTSLKYQQHILLKRIRATQVFLKIEHLGHFLNFFFGQLPLVGTQKKLKESCQYVQNVQKHKNGHFSPNF